jgi:hypothetical protein
MVAFTCSTEPTSNEKAVAEIGTRISRETAETLIGSASQQQEQKIYIYGKTMLQEILNVDGTEGILIFNGMDETGQTKLILRPADSSGEAVANSESYDDGRICPPSCSGVNITAIGKVKAEKEVMEWIQTFQSTNTNSAHSFLFGKRVFNQLLAQRGVEGVAFVKGTKSSGLDALVLVGVDENGEVMWDSEVFDDGRICPPSCKVEDL